MRKTIVYRALACLLALVTVLTCTPGAYAADTATAAAMQLSKTEGTVSVTNSSGKNVTVINNMRLYSGYHVKTAAKSYAWINLDSSKLIKLDASSEAEVRKSGKKLEVMLISGNLLFNVSEPLASDETLNIRTSTTICGIRGTSGYVYLEEEEEAEQARAGGIRNKLKKVVTDVGVLDGHVTVRLINKRDQGTGSSVSMPDTVPNQGTGLSTSIQDLVKNTLNSMNKTVTLSAGQVLKTEYRDENVTTIIIPQIPKIEVKGFVQTEIAENPDLADRVQEGTGLSFGQEEASAQLKQDQQDQENQENLPAANGTAGGTGDITAPVVWTDPTNTGNSSGSGSSSGGSSGSGSGGGSSRPSTPVYYTVTFDANGGTLSGNTVRVESGYRLGTLPTPESSSSLLAFDGWYTAPTGGEPVTADTVITADRTVYAHWKSSGRVIVTFHYNGFKAPTHALTNENGVLIGLVGLPDEREGYDTLGWSLTADGSSGLIDPSSYVFTSDTTVYAQWRPHTYTILFDSQGGSAVPSQTATHDQPLAIPETPAREYYTFTGWYTDAACTQLWDLASQKVTGPMTLYAGWQIVQHTVTFQPNTEDGTVSTTQVDHGSVIPASAYPVPTRPGYVFGGWLDGDGTLWNPEQPVVGDLVLSAQWERAAYQITFDYNGSGQAATVQETEPNGLLPSVPTASREGYRFLGWSLSPGGEAIPQLESYSFHGDTTLYAVWEVQTYTVTFDSRGGSAVNSVTVPSGGTVSAPAAPVRENYTFAGWYNGSSPWDFSTPVTGDLTLTALWTPLPVYTVTFNPNGGTVSPATRTTDTSGRLSALPTPNRDGYTFSGWYTAANGGTRVSTSTTFSVDTVVYAHWTEIIVTPPEPDTYTVTFNANGGTVSPASGRTNANGTLSSLPTPTRDGHRFDGWYTAATGGDQVSTSTTFNTNTTVYAHWTFAGWTITFDANGGTAVSPASATTNTNGILTLTELPEPTRENYTFVGWYTEATGGDQVSTSTTFNTNTTVYAHWTFAGWTITFDANGGTVSPDTRITGTDGKLSNLPNALPSDQKYSFEGWYTAKEDGDVVSADTVFTENKTVYAHWKQTAFTITFDANGGTISPDTRITGTDGKLSNLPTPTRTGYNFDGWYKVDGDDAVKTDTVFTEDTTVYAHWTPITYTVTWHPNGGSIIVNDITDYNFGTSVSFEGVVMNRDGYRFAGWYDNDKFNGEPITEITAEDIGNKDFYAKWIRILTVWFNSNDNRLNQTKTVEFDADGLITAPDNPVWDDKQFIGWYKEQECITPWDFGKDKITEDMLEETQYGGGHINLYAKYMEEIHFDLGNSTIADLKTAMTIAPREYGLFKTIHIAGGPHTIDAGFTIPNKVTLVLDSGASLVLDSNVDVVNNGYLLVESGSSFEISIDSGLENNGTVKNNGTLKNDGSIGNNGTITGNSITGDGTMLIPPPIVDIP